LRFRASGRRVVCHPDVQPAHLERIRCALELPGSEPAQGALADFFLGCPDAPAADKMAALRLVRGRLTAPMARAFEACAGKHGFARCSRMATRWSVLATASLDVPRRVLRCSTDDSHQLAAEALRAWQRGDLPAQQAFLTHCLVCRDTLALMVARRSLLRLTPELPRPWSEAFAQLQATVLPS
jgi:hypothetical protein